jgi:hypothetical protein
VKHDFKRRAEISEFSLQTFFLRAHFAILPNERLGKCSAASRRYRFAELKVVRVIDGDMIVVPASASASQVGPIDAGAEDGEAPLELFRA